MRWSVPGFLSSSSGPLTQSATVPFAALFFSFVHNSFAMLSIAQWLLKNHAHSLPQQGISINNPSVLTAVPNFTGQLFCDGIMKSRLPSNEYYLQEKEEFCPSFYTQ
jgi:hypothetical protein